MTGRTISYLFAIRPQAPESPQASAKWESYITQTERSLPPLDVVWDRCTRYTHATFCDGRTQLVVVSAAASKNRMRNRQRGPKRRVPHAPTAIGGIADGVRRSTADTLERG